MLYVGVAWCLMIVVDVWLLVFRLVIDACCSLCVVRCLLLAVRCLLVCCNVCVARCSLFDAGRLLSGVCSLLLVAIWFCVLFVVRCLLFAVCVWTC